MSDSHQRVSGDPGAVQRPWREHRSVSLRAIDRPACRRQIASDTTTTVRATLPAKASIDGDRWRAPQYGRRTPRCRDSRHRQGRRTTFSKGRLVESRRVRDSALRNLVVRARLANRFRAAMPRRANSNSLQGAPSTRCVARHRHRLQARHDVQQCHRPSDIRVVQIARLPPVHPKWRGPRGRSRR